MKLSGRSDLHVYFWPHASSLLPEGGYFGFITSSSWLETDYGFQLQRWILSTLRVGCLIGERARPLVYRCAGCNVCNNPCRCSDSLKRANNLVRFVQLRTPIENLLENDGTEAGRQEASERLRDFIELSNHDFRDKNYRILVVPQQKLWRDGCRHSHLADSEGNPQHDIEEYTGSKWGVYLRAPDLYFELMERWGKRFVPLDQLADVSYGFKSGCDAFFAPLDITHEALELEQEPAQFRKRFRCSRQEVEENKVKIIRSGDGSEHPIEKQYLMPEIHSLMTIEGVRIKRDQISRVVLLVKEPMTALKGTYVGTYLRYGQKETFGGETTVAERESCAGRPLWYDIANYPQGTIVLPIIVQYRHIVSWNPRNFRSNDALMVVECKQSERNKALAAVLNSTLVAFIKPYISRRLGNEANTQLDVYAANMMPVPNIMDMETNLKALAKAFDDLQDRPIYNWSNSDF